MWSTIFILIFCTILRHTNGDSYDFMRSTLNTQSSGNIKETPLNKLKECYDFIVVGGGSSGCVIASRLSEQYCCSVLIIDRGEDESSITNIPGRYAALFATDYVYKMETDIVEGANKTMTLLEGKGYGATSFTGTGIYTRGCRCDYDDWAAHGNTGWDYKTVLKYFLKSENARGDFDRSPYHARCGYLPVEVPPFETCLAKTFLHSGVEKGFKIVDYNEESQIGFSRIQANIHDGEKVSVSKAFLGPAKNRKTLHILTTTTARKIIIENGKVKGLEISKFGQIYTIKVCKEIILTANAILNPQLLMLSGIGPREQLEKLGIPCKKDLPGVGKNLQYQIAMPGLLYTINKACSLSSDVFKLSDEVLTSYVNDKNGPLSQILTAEAVAYIQTNLLLPKGCADVELTFSGFNIANDVSNMLSNYWGYSNRDFSKQFSCARDKDGWMIIPTNLVSCDRGSVELKNTDVNSYPRIRVNPFNPDDLKTMRKAIRFIQALSETHAFQEYESTLYSQKLAACDRFDFNSDGYCNCAIMWLINRIFRPSGTCKMGPYSDPMAVVDSKLRVYGIRGLRVGDESIMPTRPRASSSAPSIMIGEKAADMIKEAWPDKCDWW